MTRRHDPGPRGPDASALSRLHEEVAAHPGRRLARFAVATQWKGGARSDSRVMSREIAGRRLPADFIIRVDEPEALGGADTAPGPHELLLAALNACLVAGHAAAFAREGLSLESLVVETRSVVDLGPVLGVADAATPACERFECTVRLRSDAPAATLRAIHDSVVHRSPNGWCLSRPVALETRLVVDGQE